MNTVPRPSAPSDALPPLPERRQRRRRAWPLAASLALHVFLLAILAGVMAESRRTYEDGSLTVSLVPGDGGGGEEGSRPAGPPPPATAQPKPAPAPVARPPQKNLPEIPKPEPPRPKSQSPSRQDQLRPLPREESAPAQSQGEPSEGQASGKPGLNGSAGSGGPGLPGGGYSLGEVDRRPVLIRGTKPEYPYAARRAHTQGNVVVRMRIDEQGVPGDISILNADPPGVFEKNVLETLPSWRYRPAIKNGRPVPVWVTLPLRFALN